MGETVHAEFVVHSKGITTKGQELPDDLPDEEMEHIESTGALEEDGIPATDAVDAAYGTKDGKEENYLGEERPDEPEEEEPAQPPFEASDEQEEFYGEQGSRGEWGSIFRAEGGVERPTPSKVVNSKGEEVKVDQPQFAGAPAQTEKAKIEAPKEEPAPKATAKKSDS